MLFQNPDAVFGKIAKMLFLSPNFLEPLAGEVFYRRRTYVVWQSFQEIGAETAEKEKKRVFGKNLTQNILRPEKK